MDNRLLARASVGLGIASFLVALAPSVPTAALAGALAGATGIAFLSATMTALQLQSIPVMRGRVMALYSILFLGSTPIGGPLAGWIAQAFGTRWSIAMGAAAALVSGVAGLAVLRRREQPPRSRGPTRARALARLLERSPSARQCGSSLALPSPRAVASRSLLRALAASTVRSNQTRRIARVPTFTPKPTDIQRAWHVVDADGLVLGRVATEVARILRGKHKPIFAPHVDTGDHVIVINADKIVLTAGKADKKIVHRHSGYPGGLKEQTYAELLATKPTEAVRRSVRGMLPKNRLGRQMLSKLKVYAGPTHPHAAQQPQPLVSRSGPTPFVGVRSPRAQAPDHRQERAARADHGTAQGGDRPRVVPSRQRRDQGQRARRRRLLPRRDPPAAAEPSRCG